VDRMLEIRERRSKLKREFDERDGSLKTMYTQGENWLLKHLQDTGLKSFKVDGATVFTKVNQRWGIGDWSAFTDWVKATGNIDLLGKRVASTNMDQFVKEAEGETPPGIKQDAVVSVNIRKA